MGIDTRAPSGAHAASLTAPGIVLGLGLGGFIDGIVLHQIAQWHNMLSSTDRWPATTMEGMEANMRADGLFHLATWILVAMGLGMLWNALRNGAPGSGWNLVGWMLAGWGIFNVVEGVADHLVLGIHHVNEGANEAAWDIAFLAFGLLLIVGGWLLGRAELSASPSDRNV
jgi:uncharacterized membrane protein